MGKLHDTPSQTCAEAGEVHIDGPGCTCLALTPDAAAELSDRLLHSAMQARGQLLEAERIAEESRARVPLIR